MFIFGRGDYHWRHELCFYGWRRGNRPAFYGERNQDTVWEIAWGEKRSVIGHPTAKPVELFAIPLRNHTKPTEVCCDPFLGSGSQLIAADQLGRICYGLEISPSYVDVTVKRYIAHKGSDADVFLERDGVKIPYREVMANV
jgi:DNA modification methylase